MYLSDRDLRFALDTNQLIVDPPPMEIDTTSIDLHLDKMRPLFPLRCAADGTP
jgi:hypothetical protein